MKKRIITLILAAGLIACFFAEGCSKKVYTAQAGSADGTQYVAFTKALKQRLDHNKVDLTKVQFYVDQKLVLSRASTSESGNVKSGVIMMQNGVNSNDIVIPAYTPGVCERVNGDSLMISFEAQGKVMTFGALYANNNFIVLANSWNDGIANIVYDGQNYNAMCDGCGSVANAKLVVKKAEEYNKQEGGNRVVGGRMVK